MLSGRASSIEFPEIESIYDRYAALETFSTELSGWLLLHSLLDREGVALNIAANVAGLNSLCVEPEAALAKQAMRAGICDFMVTDLDEALRIFENERRKQRSISIALVGEPNLSAAEVMERGVLPELVHLRLEDATHRQIPEVDAMLARGSRLLPECHEYCQMIPVHWSVAREPMRWLPLADFRAADSLDRRHAATPWRRRWIEGGPRYLGRHFAEERFLRMTSGEADAFFAAVQHDVEAGEIQVAVSVVRNGEEELALS